ncbi:hypothetical protein X777_02690 [Ooceraea biroi]|uniref:Uncharacterized protein n=1 Tax=Ooceraea biroi TaxID=2015173 RepID=A0A026WP07_OOCBI|nr:hypothetical protein X777_02690 [Ooceraea biroi]
MIREILSSLFYKAPSIATSVLTSTKYGPSLTNCLNFCMVSASNTSRSACDKHFTTSYFASLHSLNDSIFLSNRNSTKPG